ncbi:MAG: glycosyl hydrolase family 32 [Bryobacteraceae bacterium]|jgi:hypothetical protein
MYQKIRSRRSVLKTLAATLGAAPSVRAKPLPEPISVDIGRQLFVDDYLIAQTTLRRTYHKPQLAATNPVLKPETPLEMNNGYCPMACPFQDGLFYDPKDRLYKIWYSAGWMDGTAYAYSEDGLHWVRPNLDIEPGTNRVLPRRDPYQRDGCGVWLDQTTSNARERFKMFVYHRQRDPQEFRYGVPYTGRTLSDGGSIYTAPDGIHWTERKATGPCGDNTNFFYNAFRKTWFYSIRTSGDHGEYVGPGDARELSRMPAPPPAPRVRSYRECADFVEGASWTKKDVIFFASADDRDLPDPALGYKTQLYNVDAVAYESLMLGVFAIHRGPPNDICEKGGFPKITDLVLGFSRDGIHWDRPDRTAFLACSRQPGTWNRGYLHAAGGVCLIVHDELRFYFGAFSGISPRLKGHLYAGGSTGLAILRRDGFASMDAGPELASLVTRPIVFSGRYLFVNAEAQAGQLTVELLGDDGRVMSPFTSANCRPVRGGGACQRVSWHGADDLSGLRRRPARLRFQLTNARLFSFWITSDSSGASHGYVAAGGPGFSGPTDDVGQKRV